MCYQLVLVTTLTLSEVRSMLPSGAHADALDPGRQARYRALLPDARTAVMLRAGYCACGLLPRYFREGHSDESHLRERYRLARVDRNQVARALERHRRSASGMPMEPTALPRLVHEHARNAGSSAWLLAFSAHDTPPDIPSTAPLVRRLADVADDPGAWLVEGRVTRLE